MKQRLISGIALIIGLLLVVLVAPFPVFFAVFLLIACLSIWEYSKLIYNDNPNLEPTRKWRWLYMAIIIFATLFPFFPVFSAWLAFGTDRFANVNRLLVNNYETIMFYAMFIWLFSLVIYRRTETLMEIMHPRLVALFAALSNGAFFAGVFAIRYYDGSTLSFNPNNSPVFMIYMFFLVACTDSGAYFFGRAFGKTKMSPKISPNKTLEGLLGGVFTAMICAIIFVNFTSLSDYMVNNKRMVAFYMFTLITVLFSVHGDLTESFLKRRAKIKDSSNLIPGHGGVLDRLDSLQPSFMFMAYYWLFLTLDNFFTF
ncbi:hypothetical protein CJP74_02810 [Psittacicella melopsittaci]|uniref:Phosphatidate cytidylyltransferase n=1 Tax=Psittacicella melopsittaci TaxID=2028576 RepID=A0A3A1Y4A5_9GAMM|nr:CDP-archaeol synthase [Psittacicella melopsittaci]RIY33073.1 hypothetical protein CJP74_02810 [Psittacicella melopsittaci]